MRVIGGNLKGKFIHNPIDKKTRPLKDMVRESIFNILEHSHNEKIHFRNQIILDLFSGSGSFGIECLSRGAKKIYFVENYKNTLNILKKNVGALDLKNASKIIEKNAYEILGDDFNNDKIDLIFLDPPFKDKNLNEFLLKLKNFEILNKNGIIIIHRHKDDGDNFSEQFKIVEEKKYGISKISFLTNLN